MRGKGKGEYGAVGVWRWKWNTPTRPHPYTPILFLMLLALISLPLLAAPPKHGQKRGRRAHKPVISAQEAQAAIRRKAQLRQKLHGLSGHIHQVRAKIHHAKVQENQITENIQTVEARIARTRSNLARV